MSKPGGQQPIIIVKKGGHGTATTAAPGRWPTPIS